MLFYTIQTRSLQQQQGKARLFACHWRIIVRMIQPNTLAHDSPMQIMAMTTMKDHERLELLKEVGGTKVYEERREESLKVMKETEGRRKRIEEVVGAPSSSLAKPPYFLCTHGLYHPTHQLPAGCSQGLIAILSVVFCGNPRTASSDHSLGG